MKIRKFQITCFFYLLFILLTISVNAGTQQYVNPAGKDTCRIVFGWSEDDKDGHLLSWLQRGGYVWGIELLHNIPEEKIRDFYDQKWNIILYQLSHPKSVQRYFTQKNRAIPDVDEVIQKFIRAAGGDTLKVIWQMFLEDDSNGVCLSQEVLTQKPKTHAEAYRIMHNYLRVAIEATAGYGNIHRWSVAGYAPSAHILAKQPEMDLLTIERANDDVDDLQTGIAFFRGAGRQYGKLWGVDLSLWWGCINGCIRDLPALYHKRHLFVSWYSGAEHFRIEGSELFIDKNTGTPQKITDCIDEFGTFIKTHQRGEVETPVAIILPEDHGWFTQPYWRTNKTVWNYAFIPYRQGQKALDGFLGAAFPGSNFYMDPFAFGKFGTEQPPASPFALSCISQKYAPAGSDVFMAEYPVCFGEFENRSVAKKTMHAEQRETSAYRPMGDSRWGDIFDVLTTDVSKDLLTHYKLIVLVKNSEV